MWAHGMDVREKCRYTHVIRAQDGPDRPPRGSPEHKALRARWGVAPHLVINRMAKADPQALEQLILEELTEPMTFNALSVKALGLTADVTCFTPFDDALWSLSKRGLVEHTMVAPILFRRREGQLQMPLLEEFNLS